MGSWPDAGSEATAPQRTLFGATSRAELLDRIAGLSPTQIQWALAERLSDDKDRMPLHYAANAEVVDTLIELMRAHHFPIPHQLADATGETPFFTAPLDAVPALLRALDPHTDTATPDVSCDPGVPPVAVADASPSDVPTYVVPQASTWLARGLRKPRSTS